MATNIVATSVYKINQRTPIPLINITQIGFPTQGVLIEDCSNSPTRDLGNGISVYSNLLDASGNKYYVQQTIAQLVTLFNS